MKQKYFLAILIFILPLLVFGSVIWRKVFGAPLKLTAAYLGTCPVCNCMYELSEHQVCIIRQAKQPICLVCPVCKQQK